MGGAFWLSYGVLWALVVLADVLLFALLLELGRMRLARPQSIGRDGLGVGRRLPEVETRIGGDTRILSDLINGRTLVMCALVDCPYCGPAVAAAEDIVADNASLEGVVLVAGSDAGPYLASPLPVATIATDDATRALRVRAYPFAFVVDEQGVVVAKGLANTEADLMKVLQRASARIEQRQREVIPPQTTLRVTSRS